MKVEYDDYEEHKLTKSIKKRKEELKGIQYTDLAKIKRECWTFQEETRFVLLATSSDGDDLFDRRNRLESIHKGLRKPNVEYIDMILDDAAFTDMEILIGPKASPASRIIIESLIDKFVPNFCGKINNSNILIRKE